MNDIHSKLDKLDAKLDRLDQRLDDMGLVQVGQASDLKNHIWRTELLEESVAILREESEPIKKHVQMLHGVMKFVGVVATLVGLGAGVIKIFEFIGK